MSTRFSCVPRLFILVFRQLQQYFSTVRFFLDIKGGSGHPKIPLDTALLGMMAFAEVELTILTLAVVICESRMTNRCSPFSGKLAKSMLISCH